MLLDQFNVFEVHFLRTFIFVVNYRFVQFSALRPLWNYVVIKLYFLLRFNLDFVLLLFLKWFILNIFRADSLILSSFEPKLLFLEFLSSFRLWFTEFWNLFSQKLFFSKERKFNFVLALQNLLFQLFLFNQLGVFL